MLRGMPTSEAGPTIRELPAGQTLSAAALAVFRGADFLALAEELGLKKPLTDGETAALESLSLLGGALCDRLRATKKRAVRKLQAGAAIDGDESWALTEVLRCAMTREDLRDRTIVIARQAGLISEESVD